MTASRYQFEPEPGCEFCLELDETRPNEKVVADWARSGDPYEPEVYHLLARVLREGDTVFDVGANLGFFTVMAARLTGSTGRVVAFEPDPSNIGRLRHQLEINRLANVTVVDRPASDRVAEVDFYLNSDSSGGNSLWDPALYPGNVRSQAMQLKRSMTATTLSAELKRLKLDVPKLIKIDTEGAEQKVLEGGREFLRNSAVPFVVCELHEFGLAQMGASQESLRGLMEGFGYATFALPLRNALPKLIPPATEIRGPFILNLLFSTPDMVGSYWPVEEIDPRQL